eukprot:gene35337-42819_t
MRRAPTGPTSTRTNAASQQESDKLVKQSADMDKPRPQPKWFVLNVLNYVVLVVFISSITYVALNYRKVDEDNASVRAPFLSVFFPMMVLWAGCLAYFFGFFGISFLDKDDLQESPSSYGLQDLSESTTEATEEKKDKPATKHVPRNDTTLCSDATSCVVPVSKKVDTTDYNALSDEELFSCLLSGSLKDYELEKKLGDCERAVNVRRMLYEHLVEKDLTNIPYQHYDYDKVLGANCEIVIGYLPIPLGVVGPLVLNGEPVYVPMATTEGCLVASTNRGCKAITQSGGACAVVLRDAITRAPCLKLPSAMRAAAVKRWVELEENYKLLENAFNSTTNFGKLVGIEATVAGRNIFLRFNCASGDAMGMNMVSKGCLKAIEVLQ